MKQIQSIQSSRPALERRLSYTLSVLLGLTGIALGSIPSQSAMNVGEVQVAGPDDGRGTPYKVSKGDNLCGLREPRQLSNPAKVDYGALLQATDEYEEIRSKKIDPQSARGVELHNKAHNRIVAACERARTSKGHCSVWKKISRRNGKPIQDLTKVVKRDLADGV